LRYLVVAISKVDSFELRHTGSTAPSGSFTTAPATGDAVVCSCSHWDDTGPMTVPTDNKSNTYTQRGTGTTQASYRGHSFTAHNVTGGGTFTVTLHKPVADSSAAWISGWTGVSTSATPTGSSATGSSASAAVTSGTLSGESVVVAHASQTDVVTITQPSSPWVLIGDEEDSVNYTDNNCVSQVASSGTLTATWSLGGSNAWRAHQVTIAAAGARYPPWQRPVLQAVKRAMSR
jgi:hypothetical protein